MAIDHVRLVSRLERAGTDVRWPGDLPGVRRYRISDPFGTRIELIEA